MRGCAAATVFCLQGGEHQPAAPTRLPLLFALDTKLNIPGGFRYVPDCSGCAVSRTAGTGRATQRRIAAVTSRARPTTVGPKVSPMGWAVVALTAAVRMRVGAMAAAAMAAAAVAVVVAIELDGRASSCRH